MDDDLQRFGKRGYLLPQLLPVQQGEFSENFLAGPGKFDQSFTTVFLTVPANNNAPLCHPVDQFHRAVVSKAKPGGKRGNSGTRARRQSFNCEQQLMLLRF